MNRKVTSDFDLIIIKAAQKYSLESNWIKALIFQESNGEIFALRYEPTYPWIYQPSKCSLDAGVSLPTEMTCQRMSWGLGQIMGALAREQGLVGSMGELLVPEVNIDHVCRRVKYLKDLADNVDGVFAGYNGGPQAVRKTMSGKFANQGYVDSVKGILASLS